MCTKCLPHMEQSRDDVSIECLVLLRRKTFELFRRFININGKSIRKNERNMDPSIHAEVKAITSFVQFNTKINVSFAVKKRVPYGYSFSHNDRYEQQGLSLMGFRNYI